MPPASVLFQPTVLLATALMAVIVIMILPMPAWVLDIGLAASFALAILMFTVTLFIQRPLDFSAFPTILLASLILRLSLNVASTKLIIGEGHTGTDAAGNVIEGFAMFVMGGSIILGLVIFCVILIVNFMVITKGAARMAEVGARFALDAMPGKQLAIDSDVAAGAITHEEARARREREQAETTFFGSLDGASKFVKGDAIAGLLITLLNLLVGMIVGVAVHDMPFGLAFETYAILTVGDGLVSQIPAVIISIATALLLSRGGATGTADTAIISQLGQYPAALGTVAAILGVFAVFPGLPFLPFIAGSAALALAAFRAWRIGSRVKEETPAPLEVKPRARSMGDVLDLDEIHVEFAPDLVPMILDPSTGLEARITNMRQHVATVFGLILPEIRLTDNASLPDGNYVIRIQGVEQARDRLRPERYLALMPADRPREAKGEEVREPVYGAPAMWVAPEQGDTLALSGLTIVTPTEVLATHLLEVLKRNFPRLMTLRSLRGLLDEMARVSDPARAEANRRLLDELVPDRVPPDLLLSVLRLLLEERVSVRNLPLILESVSEARTPGATAEQITENVRQRLGFQILAELRREDGTVPLIQLAPEWEEAFHAHQLDAGGGRTDVALPPDLFNRLGAAVADRIAEVGATGVQPGLVTTVRRRRFLRTVLASRGLTNPVLSYEEIGLDARPALVGLVPA